MKNYIYIFVSTGSLAVAILAPTNTTAKQGQGGYTRNEFGLAQTVSSNGHINTTGPFFQKLGTNGRTCNTCHVQDQGWGISAEDVQRRFEESDGRDPIFRTVDGSNSPNSDVSTVHARHRAYSMLTTKGLIRVERPMPTVSEFELVDVKDPYGHASASGLSLFRRPLPTTNLRFLSTVMWDGREVDPSTPMKIANSAAVNQAILVASLAHQSLDATNGHAQGAVPITALQQRQIVEFELGLSTAQVWDEDAGWLNREGGGGGPENILQLPFYIGINDNVNDPAGPFNPIAMSLYRNWDQVHNHEKASVARGEALFNSKPIVISGVKGLNDNPYFGSPASFTGSCTTCHNNPEIGNHSLAIALNIGLADGSRRTPDMPLYTLRRIVTGEKITTTDPGLALSTGKWNDIGRFKGPILRGLATRAPYFHNGFAKDFDAVIDFYVDRFGMTFTPRERDDLKAFLRTL